MLRFIWTLLLLTQVLCCELTGQITVTSQVIGAGEHGTVHRVFADLPAGATVQSIYSDEFNPLTLNAAEGTYQSDGSSLLLNAANAGAEDSWFTIGVPEGVSEVQSAGGAGWNAAVASFASGGDFSSSGEFGGAFFLLPVSNQGMALEGQVLLGQFVSTGSIELVLNIQWKPGPGLSSVLSPGLTLVLSPTGGGCTSESALNYDPSATQDNGSCQWPSPSFSGLSYSVHAAATDSLPATYRIYAQFENPNEGLSNWFGTPSSPILLETTTTFYQSPGGAVSYPSGQDDVLARDSWVTIGEATSSIIVGMSEGSFEDGGVLQSDPEFGGAIAAFPGSGAGIPDSTGRVLMAQVTTNGTVQLQTNLSVVLEDGSSMEILGAELTIAGNTPGCMDELACNFNDQADEEDGSCTYPDALGDCGGDCTADTDGDGVCDDAEIAGCTDPAADNFDEEATEDDGTCVEGEPEDPDTSAAGFLGLVQQEVGMGPDGVAIYRIYAQFDAAGYELISLYGTENHPWMASSTSGFYQSPDGGPLATNLPSIPTTTSPSDSWFTIGGDGYDSIELLAVGLDFSAFEQGGDFIESDSIGGAIFTIPGAETTAVSGQDGRVLIAQLSSLGSIEILINLKFINLGGGSPEVVGISLTIPTSVLGCNDEDACNYSSGATADDGSCIYPTAGYDCLGECLGDADLDGVCDANEYSGCGDEDACNYDPLVDADNQIAATCDYPADLFGATHFNCDGTCQNDSDGDGTCDEDEIEGCTYAAACNFESAATEEDGSCVFAQPWQDCAGNCLFDFNGDGQCDETGMGGCTYYEAYNYDAEAAYDDGSCAFPEGNCIFDSNGDGGVNITDLLDMLVALGTTCPQ
jgi:hypothetical protein